MLFMLDLETAHDAPSESCTKIRNGCIFTSALATTSETIGDRVEVA